MEYGCKREEKNSMSSKKKVAGYVKKIVALAMVMTLVLSMVPFTVGAFPAGGTLFTIVAQQVEPGDREFTVTVSSDFGHVTGAIEWQLYFPNDIMAYVSGTNHAPWGSAFAAMAVGNMVGHTNDAADMVVPVAPGLMWTGTFRLNDEVEPGTVIEGFDFTATDGHGASFEVNLDDASFTFEDLALEPENYTVAIRRDVTMDGVDRPEILIDITHDGTGTERLYLVVQIGAPNVAGTPLIYELDVAGNGVVRTISTAAFPGANAQISAWLLDAPSLATGALSDALASANTNN